MNVEYVYILLRIPFWRDGEGELQFGWAEIKGVFLFREDAINKIPRGYEKTGRSVWRNEERGYFTIEKKKVQ